MSSSKKRLTIQDLDNFGKRFNIKCLSTEYIDVATKYLWQCSNGHIFEAKYRHIAQGKGMGCSQCNKANNIVPGHKRIKIEDCHKLAQERNGKCLSTEYINSKSKLVWECQYGHIFKSCWNNAKSGNCWCPKCCKEKRIVFFTANYRRQPIDRSDPNKYWQ